MNYNFKIIKDDNFFKPYISFSDSTLKGTPLVAFLNGEVDIAVHNSDWLLEGLDNALKGRSEYEERDGECFGLAIKKDITEVSNLMEDEPVFKIETKTLRDLVEAIANARKNKK